MKKIFTSIALILLFLVSICSCKKNTKTRSIVTGVTWSLNSKTYTSNSIQMDFQESANGYYEVICTADGTTEKSELTFAINNGTSIGDHTTPSYWVYCSIYNKSSMNSIGYVFESYTLNISSVYSSFVTGNFTALKNLGPTLTCTFNDINSAP